MLRSMALAINFVMTITLVIGTSPFSAKADEHAPPAGWTIKHGRPGVCMAKGPLDGRAAFSFVALGPMFSFLIDAPDLPSGDSSYQAVLVIDDGPPMSTVALGRDHIIMVRLGRGESAKMTAAASLIAITVEHHTYRFSIHNAAAALDAVARCAGQQTLSMQVDQPATAIIGAGGWQLYQSMPGVPGDKCSARIAGDQIDTLMLLGKDGRLVLIGGHNNWAAWPGGVPLQLRIDNYLAVQLTAHWLGGMIVVSVTDPSLVERLRGANTLDWTTPTGHVRGGVLGLGIALDAMKKCKQTS